MYPSVSAHLEWCRAAGYSDNTVDDRRKLLVRIASDLGPLAITDPDQLTRWFAHDGWSAQTRATYQSHLRGYFEWAVRAGRQPTNPMDRLQRPSVPKRAPRPAHPSIFARIVAAATDPWRTAALLARYAGLRCCEIARLRREDVTEEDLVVVGKGGRLDILPTHPRIWAAVRSRPQGLLVTNRWGGAYPPDTLSNRFGEVMRGLGYPGVTLHPLRHLYATTLLRAREHGGAGANLRVVQELCRHASPATTAVYTQVTDEERRTAIAALPAVA